MLEVISSYQELTGFLPVELTDKCSTAEVMSDNYTSQWLVNFGGRRPLTPFNSQQAELAKVKSNNIIAASIANCLEAAIFFITFKE